MSRIKELKDKYKNDCKRRPVSFKNNERDLELMEWVDLQNETIGTSTYIKLLIEQDMKNKKKE